MSLATALQPSVAPGDDSFPSAAGLRAAHSSLLRRERVEGAQPEFIAEVSTFIRRGCTTGKILDDDADRRACQSILDYWTTVLYRADEVTLDSTLDEFDASLAPTLPEELCPYIGLEAFGEANRERFFGRRRLIGDLLEKLREHCFLAVVGPSGSGKSSLVLGGLIPALKAAALPESDAWHYFPRLVPGSDPFASLARAVHPPNVKLNPWIERLTTGALHDATYLTKVIGALTKQPSVLVIDQFEELFTLCTNQQILNAFIDNLLVLINAPGPRHTVILTMRSDFETYIVRLPQLQALFEQAQTRVTPMSAPDLREAIEEPARQVGLKIEPRVIDALISDIIGEPAALPLLQFTLLKLWDQRDHNRVSWETYQRVGGGRLALARSADALYHGLSPEQQRTTRRILLRMVRPTAGLEFTSNRIRRDQLYQGGEAAYRIDEVLGKLVHARLVRLSAADQPEDTQVEVAHEALVRNWPMLVEWLEQEREALRERQRLTIAAENWKSRGEDANTLLRGAVLSEALRLPAADLSRIERDFLRASLQARLNDEQNQEAARRREIEQARALAEEQRRRAEAERQRAEEQLRRAEAEHRQTQERSRAEAERQRAEEQARARRFLRIFVGALAVALILSLIAGIIALQSSFYATQQQNAAQTEIANRNTAVVQANAARATSQADANARGTEAAIRATAEAAANTAQARAQSNANARGTEVARRGIAVAEALAAQATSQADVRSRSTAEAGARAAQSTAQAEIVLRSTAEADARTAQAVAQADAASRATAQALAEDALAREREAQNELVHAIAARGESEANQLIRLAQGEVQRNAGRALQYALAAFQRNPNVGDWLQEMLQRQPKRGVAQHGRKLVSLAWGPDGSRFITTGDASDLAIWDATTFNKVASFSGFAGQITAIAWSPDNSRIAAGSTNGTALIWSVTDGHGATTLLHTSSVNGVAWSGDSTRLLTATRDGTLHIWDLVSQKETRTINNGGSQVSWAAWNPNNDRIMAITGNHAIVWNVADGTKLFDISGQSDSFNCASFSPDGQRIATAGADGQIHLWNASDGTLLLVSEMKHAGAANTVFWSPDGQQIISTGDDRIVQVWDPNTGNRLHELRGASAPVVIATWNPNGRSIVAAMSDGTARVFPIDTNDLTAAAVQIVKPLSEQDIQQVLSTLTTPTIAPTSTPTSIVPRTSTATPTLTPRS